MMPPAGPAPLGSPFARLFARMPADVQVTAGQRRAYIEAATRAGDPEADAVVAMFRRLPAGVGRRMFDLAVDHGITAVEDPPPELTAFFSTIDTVPYWVDTRQLDVASRVVGRSGVAGDIALSMGALLGGYLAHRVAKTLVGTGDLDRMAPRRLGETMHWFVEVTAPGGLNRFAPGFRSTLRVRLMHALVRAGMTRRPDWDWDNWDHPVNQSQMAGTTVFFAIAQIAGTQALGIHVSREEQAAIYAFWRYTGFLLGVSPDLLPATDRDFWTLFRLQVDYEFDSPDADSVRLAQALVRAIGPLIIGERGDAVQRLGRRAATEFCCSYARVVLGNAHADFLGLPDSVVYRSLVAAAATVVTGMEGARRVIPGATGFVEHRGRRRRAATVARMMAQHGGDHRFARDITVAATTRSSAPRSVPPRPARPPAARPPSPNPASHAASLESS